MLWYHTVVRPFCALDGNNMDAGSCFTNFFSSVNLCHQFHLHDIFTGGEMPFKLSKGQMTLKLLTPSSFLEFPVRNMKLVRSESKHCDVP